MNDKQFKYLIKLIVIMGVCTAGLSMLATSVMLEINLKRRDNSTKRMIKWSKKADLANEILEDMFRVQRMKESYERQGIKATEEKEDEL